MRVEPRWASRPQEGDPGESPAPPARVHSKGAATGVVEEGSPQALTRLPPRLGFWPAALGEVDFHPVCGALSRSSEGSG